MEKTFSWRSTQGAQNSATLCRDDHGLPMLHVTIEDDHYSGNIEFETLFALVTELALHQCNTLQRVTSANTIEAELDAEPELATALGLNVVE